MTLGWKFPSSRGGQIVGLNNGDIETFKDKPIKYLAREVVQNSLDANINEEPVKVCFKSFKMSSEKFPDKQGLMNALIKGNERWGYIPDSKDFYENAINVLNSEEIEILRVSDFNTSGLTGSATNTGNWNNLVNSTGVSAKDGNKSGSHGIGKNAPFACSNLRTVFYSTLDIEGNIASKGVAKLASFCAGINEDGSEDITQATGFFGHFNDYKIDNIDDVMNLDQNYHRETPGTDIYVTGFRNDFFKDKLSLNAAIISEIIDSFLVAIWNGKLIIEVDDVEVSKNTLPLIVKNYQKQLDKTTVMVYQMLEENVEWINLPFDDIDGSVKLALKFDKNANNRISMYRNTGMKIYDDFNRCSTLRYIGLAIIEGTDLNNYLRKLENASHNKWEPNRYKPQVSKELLNKLFKLISNALNERAEQYQDEESDIDKAGDYLPDEIQTNDNVQITKHSNRNLNKIINIERKIHSKITTSASMATAIIDDGLISKTEGKVALGESQGGQAYLNLGKRKKKKGFRDPEETNVKPGLTHTGKKDINVKSKGIRIFCIDRTNQVYRFMFTPDTTYENCYIEFYKVAEFTERETLAINKIVSSSQDGVESKSNKIINLEFFENVPIVLDLQFLGKEYTTMEVKMYAHKK